MEQFHFGDEERALFGVYHPAGGQTRRPAVLICNPFGAEAIRAHRVLRVLAGRLATSGHAVLRFDYYGSGDAGGACEEFTLAGAQRDILTAHEELLAMSGATRVIWAGLRLGAGLALAGATGRPKGLAGLVLWDPVVNGVTYLEELITAHPRELAQLMDMSEAQYAREFGTEARQDQSLGFALPQALQAELKTFQADALEARPARSVALIGAPDDLAGRLTDLNCKVNQHADPDAQDWNSDAALNSFAVPMKTVQLITELAGEIR